MTQVTRRPNTTLTRQRLLHFTALANIIALRVIGIVLSDTQPLGLAVVSSLGLERMHLRGGRLGLIVLGLPFCFAQAEATVRDFSQST